LLFTLLGIIVTVACAYASARRLWFATDATALDPAELANAARGEVGGPEAARTDRAEVQRVIWRAVCAEIAREPGADWEQDLFAALRSRDSARVALVNEQLAELDFRAQRWGRVPRVCASISSSASFLFAALAMRAGLASDEMDIEGAIVAAINVVAVGVAGTAFSIAAHVRAQAMTRARLAATDKLVERLEAWAETETEDRTGPEPGDKGIAAVGGA
jgi:hypothetical protein